MLWEVGEVRTGSLIPQVQGIRRKKKKNATWGYLL